MKIIVTGFEPFNARSINASYEVISRLDNVEKLLLPVCWNKVGPIINDIYNKKPDVVMLCGEAASYDNIAIETLAHNISNGKDNDQITKDNEPIIANGTDIYQTKAIYQQINDVNISKDAGKYLCNYTYYLALDKFKDTNTIVVFVHFPLIKQQGGKYDLDYLVNKAKEILETIKK